jgi:hypothetical protein
MMGVNRSSKELNAVQLKRIERAQALARWSADVAPLSEFVTEKTREGLDTLDWERVHDIPLLMWEIHHDGSQRLDFSLTEQPDPRSWSPLLVPAVGKEFDFLDGGPVFMGHFVMTRVARVTNALRYTQNALISSGSDVDLDANRAVAQLTEALGPPHFIGVTSRGSGTRLVTHILSAEAWESAHAVLRTHGLPDEVLMSPQMVAALLTQGIAFDLSIDVARDRVSHRAAMKIGAKGTTDHTHRVIADALESLGVPTQGLQEALPFLRMPAVPAPADIPHTPLDGPPVSLRTSHVKVDLSTDPPSLKSYLVCTSLEL